MRAANQFADAATGVVYVHASPAAVCPHVEWALSSTLQARANLKWTPQPAMPGQLRAVTNWVGPVGTGAQLANALRLYTQERYPEGAVQFQRVVEVVVGADNAPFLIGQRVLVKFMRTQQQAQAGRCTADLEDRAVFEVEEVVDLAVGVGMGPAHEAVADHADIELLGHLRLLTRASRARRAL